MKTLKIITLLGLSLLLTARCTSKKEDSASAVDSTAMKQIQYIGSVEITDPSFTSRIDEKAQLEVLAEGFEWTEGPVWVEDGGYLLYSDIPPNSIFKWSEAGGNVLYLKPSGFTGEIEREGEPGSNGLVLNSKGQLVLCQHGDRRMAVMEAPLNDPAPKFTTIADSYDGMRFNSPNDAVYHSNGNLYITDPPYGLEKNMDDPAKEIPFQGVYRIDQEGGVHLMTDTLTRPNGIGLSPDGKTLYVANSDGEKMWYSAYDLDENGNAANGRLFFDVTPFKNEGKGGPDGMAVDREGNIWATGPGGVWVFSPEAKVLAKIRTGQATANCTLDTREEYLYITADMYLLRLKIQ